MEGSSSSEDIDIRTYGTYTISPNTTTSLLTRHCFSYYDIAEDDLKRYDDYYPNLHKIFPSTDDQEYTSYPRHAYFRALVRKAIIIQTAFRGYLARKTYGPLIKEALAKRKQKERRSFSIFRSQSISSALSKVPGVNLFKKIYRGEWGNASAKPFPRQLSLNLNLEAQGDEGPEVGGIRNCETDVILFLGGLSSKKSHSSEKIENILIYDIKLDRWNTCGVMAEPRVYHASVVYEGSIFVIGGCNPEKRTADGELVATDTVFHTTVRTEQSQIRASDWERCPSMSFTRAQHCTVVVDKCMYVFGGRDSKGFLLNTAEKYDSRVSKWENIAPLLLPVMGASATVCEGLVWVIGGITNIEEAKAEEEGRTPFLKTIQCYDPVLDRWYKQPELPEPRAFCSALTIRREIWVFGGITAQSCDSLQGVSSVAVANAQEGEWELRYSGPNCYAMAVTKKGSRVYLIGGAQGSTTKSTKEVNAFDCESGKMKKLSPLPRRVTGATAIILHRDYTQNLKNCYFRDLSEETAKVVAAMRVQELFRSKRRKTRHPSEESCIETSQQLKTWNSSSSDESVEISERKRESREKFCITPSSSHSLATEEPSIPEQFREVTAYQVSIAPSTSHCLIKESPNREYIKPILKHSNRSESEYTSKKMGWKQNGPLSTSTSMIKQSPPKCNIRPNSPPKREYSRSKSPPKREYSRSKSPPKRDYSRSKSLTKRDYSRSVSPPKRDYSRSRSPPKRDYSRSRSESPPKRDYSRSKSPPKRDYSRSKSSHKGDYRSRSKPPHRDDNTLAIKHPSRKDAPNERESSSSTSFAKGYPSKHGMNPYSVIRFDEKVSKNVSGKDAVNERTTCLKQSPAPYNTWKSKSPIQHDDKTPKFGSFAEMRKALQEKFSPANYQLCSKSKSSSELDADIIREIGPLSERKKALQETLSQSMKRPPSKAGEYCVKPCEEDWEIESVSERKKSLFESGLFSASGICMERSPSEEFNVKAAKSSPKFGGEAWRRFADKKALKESGLLSAPTIIKVNTASKGYGSGKKSKSESYYESAKLWMNWLFKNQASKDGEKTKTPLASLLTKYDKQKSGEKKVRFRSQEDILCDERQPGEEWTPHFKEGRKVIRRDYSVEYSPSECDLKISMQYVSPHMERKDCEKTMLSPVSIPSWPPPISLGSSGSITEVRKVDSELHVKKSSAYLPFRRIHTIISPRVDPNLGTIASLETRYNRAKIVLGLRDVDDPPQFARSLKKATQLTDSTFPTIVTLGGLNPKEPTNRSIGKCMLFYHPLRDRWEFGGMMPLARCFHAVAAVKGRIYVIGGYDPNLVNSGEMLASKRVCSLDIRTLQWQENAKMNQARAHHALVSYRNRLYVFGGRDDSGSVLKSVEVYYPKKDQWSHCADMPNPRMGVAATARGDVIWVFGGVTSMRHKEDDPLQNSVLCYYPDSDKWSSVGAECLPYPRAFASAVTVDSKVFVIGGATRGKTRCHLISTPGVDLYDCNNDSWTKIVRLNRPRHCSATGIIGSCIYIIGGMCSPEWSPTTRNELYCVDEDVLLIPEHLPMGLTGMGAVVLSPSSTSSFWGAAAGCSTEKYDRMILSKFGFKQCLEVQETE